MADHNSMGLLELLISSLPKIRKTYRNYYVSGYEARLHGDMQRHIHARRSHKHFYRNGWEDADATIQKAEAKGKTRRKTATTQRIYKLLGTAAVAIIRRTAVAKREIRGRKKD